MVEKIFYEIENNQDYVKGKKLLRLDDFTDFDWDRVHVLYGHMYRESISEVTGVDYTGTVPGDSDYLLVVFIKDNHVVYDEIYSGYESSKRVKFDLGDNIYKGRDFSRKECVFKVKNILDILYPTSTNWNERIIIFTNFYSLRWVKIYYIPWSFL